MQKWKTPKRLKPLEQQMRSQEDLTESVKEYQKRIKEAIQLRKEMRVQLTELENYVKQEKSNILKVSQDIIFFERELRLFKTRFYSHRKWRKEHLLHSLPISKDKVSLEAT